MRVFDYVEEDDLFLLVMELLAGGSLDDRVEAGTVSPHEACAVGLATAGALHYAHQQGILHRDVKPANVMFAADGSVKLGDFGIAKVLETRGGLTATGSIMGTPAYMAPEQATGDELGPWTDVYAAGVMTYQLLAGRLPFAATGDAIAHLYQHVNQPPRPLAEAAPQVPRALATVVHRALEKDPADRYASAEELGVALAEAGTAAYGPGWLAATGIPVLTSGALSSALERGPAPDPEATVPGLAALPRTASEPTPAPAPASGPTTSSRRRLARVALALALLAAVGGGLALLMRGDDDGGPTPADGAAADSTDPAEAPAAPIPADLLDRFDRECRERGVDPEQCGCVADGVGTAGLTPDEFDEAIDQLAEDGGLINGLDPLFQTCAPS